MVKAKVQSYTFNEMIKESLRPPCKPIFPLDFSAVPALLGLLETSILRHAIDLHNSIIYLLCTNNTVLHIHCYVGGIGLLIPIHVSTISEIA